MYIRLNRCKNCGKHPNIISKWVKKEKRYWITCYCGRTFPDLWPLYMDSEAKLVQSWNNSN